MKRAVLILILFFPLFVISQSEIKGRITDTNEPIVFANIILTNPNNDNVIGTTSDFDGNFTLNAKNGIYTLTISYVGYTTYTSNIKLEKNLDLGLITLTADQNALDEVVITSRKKLIEQKPDRLIFNVENSITASNGDALDALKIAPGLQLQNGEINMFGKGNPRVLINDRLLPLSGEELTSYLNTLSANDIKKIEIITSPPAKYEASGNGGLINIILKKGTQNAWKNTVAITHNIDTYNFTTFRNSLLYNKNKWNVSLSLDKTRGYIRGKEDFQVYYPESTWDIDIKTKDHKKALSGRLLLDYQLSDKTTIGIQYLGSKTNPDISDTSVTSIYNTNNTLDSLLINNGGEFDERISNSLNLHAITKLDTLGRKLSIDADYFNYDAEKSRDFLTKSYDANYTFQNINQSARGNSIQNLKNRSFKVDMEHPIQAINLSYGVKISATESESKLDFFNTITGTPELDTNISNSFKYTENNQAIYINGNKTINDKWQVQLGLRLENTQTEGFSKELNQTTKNNYAKLFPTVFIMHNSNDNNVFSFSYSKRIQRPAFSHLNPFRIYVSSNTYNQGNPFLQPSFNDNFELKHTFKNKLTTNIFYNIRSNASGIIFTSSIEDNTQIVTRENFFNQYTIGIGQSYVYNKLSWIQSVNNFNLIHVKSKFNNAINAQPQNGISYVASTSNTFKIDNQNKIQLDANYNSKAKSDLFSIGDSYSIDLGYSTSFLDKSLNFSVLVKDIFATSYLNNLESNVNGVRQVYGQNRNNRYVRFSLNYNFGNKKIKGKNRQFGNSEETRRVN
ncbi:outer membrane beta-barrel family protein [Postechiella marina]|uniref:Outer membrane beta-barrel family protein n=1 Tax=Postechiella marina TaxID=943941 RepID=A0ABP8CG89_9FLAO